MPSQPGSELRLYFDGGCDPNPGGIATYGFLVYSGRTVKVRKGGSAAEPGTPEATNNVAEYMGLIRGLEYILTNGLGKRSLAVFGDSKLVIGQITGEMKVKNPKMKTLHTQAMSLVEELSDVTFSHIYREENREADRLATEARQEIRWKQRGKRR
ncbi:MAG: ribonuclease HI family protein [Gammaproteobacteria bacterium]|nr:ribonuclease HI family protein [Gammaproteobacteria bacterium]